MTAITEDRKNFSEWHIDQMEDLAEELGGSCFDLMLVGDGSGNTYRDPCGFACIAYNRNRRQGSVHRGGFNHGTNNFAELMPYVHALWHYVSSGSYDGSPVKVLIVSDSELTVKQGMRSYRRESNACLWAAIDWFEKNGFSFEWRHVYRNTNPMNAECDSIAGSVRKKFI